MTSREIAAIAEKRHDNVMRVCRDLRDTGVCPQIEETPYIEPTNGRTYAQCLLNQRDSYVVMARLSPEFTARLVDRWQELESGATPAHAIPATYAAALRLAAEQAEQIEQQAAALALAAPKVEFVDRYVSAPTSSMGIREVVKLLKTNGHTVNEHSFTAWLVSSGFMYRKQSNHPDKLGRLTPAAQHEKAGRFETKTGQGANGHTVPVYKFTGKGVSWIVGEWAKHQICGEVVA